MGTMNCTDIRFPFGRILRNGETALAWVAIDGVEVKTLIGNDDGTLWAKRPGDDAGVTTAGLVPSSIVII